MPLLSIPYITTHMPCSPPRQLSFVSAWPGPFLKPIFVFVSFHQLTHTHRTHSIGKIRKNQTHTRTHNRIKARTAVVASGREIVVSWRRRQHPAMYSNRRRTFIAMPGRRTFSRRSCPSSSSTTSNSCFSSSKTRICYFNNRTSR